MRKPATTISAISTPAVDSTAATTVCLRLRVAVGSSGGGGGAGTDIWSVIRLRSGAGSLALRPGSTRTESSPAQTRAVVLRANAYSETVRVQLPAGFAVDEVPDAVKIETPFGSYVTSYEVKNNELIFKRSLSQQAATIAPADYELVRKFFESIRAAENAPVVLARK